MAAANASAVSGPMRSNAAGTAGRTAGQAPPKSITHISRYQAARSSASSGAGPKMGLGLFCTVRL